jgi:hexosaminidase
MAKGFAALSTALLLLATPALAIWPQPATLETGSTALTLSKDFRISVDVNHAPKDLTDAVQRTKRYLKSDKLERLVPDRGASNKTMVDHAKKLSSLKLVLEGGKAASIASEAIKPIGERSEGYSLEIPENGGEATLSANSTLGLFRGLATFEQIWYDLDGHTYTLEAPFNIVDAPAYPYRGLMLDTARNYYPVEDLKRTLDAMSWVKMNTFHWHVVDSQSFPLVIPGYEGLSEQAAYSKSSVYTPKVVKDLVAYANARGIDVIAEIDTPGHTSAISKVYPDHIACPEASPWATYAAEPPAGQLRVASAATVNFTSELLTAASELFTSSYFSTGGDEVNAKCYEDDQETQDELTKQGINIEQALDSFTQATHAALQKAGKTPVVWEEMAITHNVTLSNDTLIFVWISAENAAAVADKGYRIIHASNDYFYLDCGAGAWVGDFSTGNSWCDPFKSWQKAYTFDPKANLTAEQGELVIGGQHLLWAEQSGPENLDSIVWPRTASSAEVFWSGEGGDVQAALARLHDVSFRFRQRGVKTISLQPMYCALRPGICDLTA